MLEQEQECEGRPPTQSKRNLNETPDRAEGALEGLGAGYEVALISLGALSRGAGYENILTSRVPDMRLFLYPGMLGMSRIQR